MTVGGFAFRVARADRCQGPATAGQEAIHLQSNTNLQRKTDNQTLPFTRFALRSWRNRISVHGVKTPLAATFIETRFGIMNLLVILIVLMLLFGGGGFYVGGPLIGGGGLGLILLICLILFLSGRLGSR
jgi:hypothetical protein